MNISPEEAVKLLNNGSISEQNFEDITKKSHQNIPSSPSPKEEGGILNKIGSAIGKVNPLQIAGNVASAVNDYGKFSAQDTTQMPTFDVTHGQTTATKEKLPAAKEEALGAAKRAAQTEQNILTPVAKEAKESVLSETQKNLLINQKRTEDVWNKFQQDQQNAREFLDDAKAKAEINPNRYLQEMGVTQKLFTAVGLVLGSGGERANKFLDMQIDRDIAAQQKDIENDILKSARASGIGQNEINAGQVSILSQSIAQQMVVGGTIAGINAAKAQVQGATATANADALIFPLTQKELDAQLLYDQTVKGVVSAQDYQTLSLFGKYLEKLGVIPKGQSAKTRVNPQDLQFETPAEEVKKETKKAEVPPEQKVKKIPTFNEKLEDLYNREPKSRPIGGFR